MGNNNNNNNNSNNKQAGTRTIQSTTKGACVPVCQFSSAYFCGILHSQTHHCKLLHLYLSSHLPKCQHICTRDTFVLFSGRPQHSLIRYLNPLCRWVLLPDIQDGLPDGFRWVALLPDIHSIIKFDVE